MEDKRHQLVPRRGLRSRLIPILLTVFALLATTVGPAEAQTDERVARPERDVETLRLACQADFIDGQRGVLCRWSEAENPRTRAYQLYRTTDGSARQLVTTVGVDGRLGYFDTGVSAPSQLVYGVVSVNHNGRLLGRSKPVHVQFGQDIEKLRMACSPDSIDGHRGVLCRWSKPSQSDARGYLVYRIVNDGPREVIARIPADARRAHFDRDIVVGGLHIYGVTAVDSNGAVIAMGGPRRVQWPGADR